MADQSAIEWTDATWNPVTGCSKVSPGCAHCYAETFAKRGLGRFKGGRPFEDVQCHEQALDIPLRWQKPRRIFVNSMSDLFHEKVGFHFIAEVFTTMAQTTRHTFQVLTKRPERLLEFYRWNYRHAIATGMMSEEDAQRDWLGSWPNVWLGVSVENQRFADERIPLLLQTPAAVRFISAEPLLQHVNLDTFLGPLPEDGDGAPYPGSLSWVIVGGESGPSSRPFDLAWARSIVEQCRAARVPVFVKQLGAKPLQRILYGAATFDADQPVHPEPLRLANRKGGDPAEWPEDLRVREFPKADRQALSSPREKADPS